MTQNLLQSLDYSVLQQCMHCGMCLPTCPTYVESGRERSSPRGRIALMRAVADGELGTTPLFAEEMSYCVGCLACVTACPAGVDYTELLETARAQAERSMGHGAWGMGSGMGRPPSPGYGVASGARGAAYRAWRTGLRAVTMRGLFVHPRLLRTAGRMLWLYQASGLQALARKLRLTALLPRRLRELEPSIPRIQRKFSDSLISEVEPARGERRFRVAMLTGCVQDLVFPDVNRATVDVLRENGCEVVTPRVQHCCGSLHAHNGDLETARLLARRQLDEIDPAKFDSIISNAAGCGSHLKHYDRLLADDLNYADRAAEWSRKLKDVSEWLVEIGFRTPSANLKSQISDLKLITYHEACHLCHGQKVSAQPRQILRAIPGLELKEAGEATWCCGSAGIYSITQPETAAWLLGRKLKHLQATGAQIIAMANPGCHLQIENGLRAACVTNTRVVHPVVLLAEAYRAERQV